MKQVAAEQAVKPEELLESAWLVYRRQLDREKISEEARAFRILHPELVRQ